MSASNRSVLTSTDNCDDEAAWPHQLFDMRVVGGAGRGEGWPCGGITKYHQLYTSWKLSRQSQCFVSTGRTVTGDNDKEAPARDLYFPQTEHNIGDTVCGDPSVLQMPGRAGAGQGCCLLAANEDAV